MKMIEIDINEQFPSLAESCACIGYFDGVHKGHRALIAKTQELAAKYGCKSSLITFCPDPYRIIYGKKRRHIQTFEKRLDLIKALGVDIVYLVRFDEKTASLNHSVFSRTVLGNLALRAIVCGFDFRYGAAGEGDCKKLEQELSPDAEVVILPEVCDGRGKISSSRIRSALQEGDISEANRCLGYDYFVEGRVVSGRKNGRKMGYPTANIAYSEEQLLPKYGVYSAYVFLDGRKYAAMVNYGITPTVADRLTPTLEAHILDFEGDLYGKVLCVFFTRRLRGERRFDNLESLSEQLKEDEKNVRKDYGDVEVISF